MTDTPRALASQEASRPDPALGHPAAPGSTVASPAPLSEPCATELSARPVKPLSIQEIRRAGVLSMEDAVIASLPPDLRRGN